MLIKLYEIRIAFKDINLKPKGRNGLQQKELDQQYVKVALDDKEYEGSSGIPVATTVETVREKERKSKTFVYIDRKIPTLQQLVGHNQENVFVFLSILGFNYACKRKGFRACK